MKNIIKGWVTSLLGLAIIVIDVLYFFGIIRLTEGAYVPKSIEIGVALLIGILLFLMPYSKIEAKAEKVLDKITGNQ